jgi:hypothetical protein
MVQHRKQKLSNTNSTKLFFSFIIHCVIFVLIVEDHIVTVKCRTAIKAAFLYLILCLSVMLDIFSCSFTSISRFCHSTYKLLLLHKDQRSVRLLIVCGFRALLCVYPTINNKNITIVISPNWYLQTCCGLTPKVIRI